jgi:hypothetical protein
MRRDALVQKRVIGSGAVRHLRNSVYRDIAQAFFYQRHSRPPGSNNQGYGLRFNPDRTDTETAILNQNSGFALALFCPATGQPVSVAMRGLFLR